jgi:YidC/Oxa1 family membrane protein insertase
MGNLRIFLWMALLFLVWLNVDAWMKDYGAKPAPAPAAATTPAAAQSAAQPASSLTESVPTLGETQPASPAAQASVPGSDVTPPSATLRVVTDVLDLDVSLTGGDLVRADLLKYPVRKDNPATGRNSARPGRSTGWPTARTSSSCRSPGPTGRA